MDEYCDKEMRRVLCVDTRPFGPDTGGQLYDLRIRKVLQEGGYDVESVALYESLPTSSLRKAMSPLKALRLLPLLLKSDKVILNSTSGFYFIPLTALVRIANSLRRWWPGGRSDNHNTSITLTHHHFLHKEFGGLKRLTYKAMEVAYLNLATDILTSSPFVVPAIKKIAGCRATAIAIPFDAPEVAPGALCPVKGRWLSVGTIESRKGLHHILQGLAGREDRGECELHFAGKIVDETYAESLRKMASDIGVSLILHGRLSAEALQEEWQRADLLLFPSEMEGYGMVLAESRFYGLPVVCFRASVMPESVTQDVDGLMATPFDGKELVECAMRITQDRGLRARLSEASLKRSHTYPSFSDFHQEVLNYFRVERLKV